MGWFGMPNMNKQQAFDELYSQSQYVQKFELLWQKHTANRSYVVFTLDGKYFGEITIWHDDGVELMYKPITWLDEISRFPKKYHRVLLGNSSERERAIYVESIKQENEKNKIQPGTVFKTDKPIEFTSGKSDDTFEYMGHNRVYAMNAHIFVSGFSKNWILHSGFTIVR